MLPGISGAFSNVQPDLCTNQVAELEQKGSGGDEMSMAARDLFLSFLLSRGFCQRNVSSGTSKPEPAVGWSKTTSDPSLTSYLSPHLSDRNKNL